MPASAATKPATLVRTPSGSPPAHAAASPAGDGRERFMRRPEVERMTGLSRAHIYRLIKTGQFPAPIPLLSTRVVVWLASEIDAWIAAQISAHRRN